MTSAPTDYGDAWADFLDEWSAMAGAVPDPAELDLVAATTADGTLLELGVGTGYLAIPLAERGVAVEGLDASPQMLERLTAKAPGIVAHLADASAFDVGRTYDAILFGSGSISCLPDHAAMASCFASIARHLRPGGRFLIESIVHQDAWYGDEGTLHFIQARGEGWKMHWFATNHPETRTVSVERVLKTEGAADRRFPHTECHATPAELDAMATAAGLDLVGRWGAWDQRPLEDSHTRCVAIYERPAS